MALTYLVNNCAGWLLIPIIMNGSSIFIGTASDDSRLLLSHKRSLRTTNHNYSHDITFGYSLAASTIATRGSASTLLVIVSTWCDIGFHYCVFTDVMQSEQNTQWSQYTAHLPTYFCQMKVTPFQMMNFTRKSTYPDMLSLWALMCHPKTAM